MATEGDEIVGWADAQLRWELREPGVGEAWAGVGQQHRGRGHGAALLAAAQDHLRAAGAVTVESWAEEDDGKRFLRGRGFGDRRETRMSAVDLRTVDLSALPGLEAAKAAEGFRATPLRELPERGRELYEVYMAGAADMPEDHPEDNVAFDEWDRETLEHPDLDPDGSFVVVTSDGRPVSLALLEVDRVSGRATNEMTATLPGFRRRGLARLAKLASLRWAAEFGITSILTGNDRENVGMLALNDELGYRVLVRRAVFRLDLTD